MFGEKHATLTLGHIQTPCSHSMANHRAPSHPQPPAPPRDPEDPEVTSPRSVLHSGTAQHPHSRVFSLPGPDIHQQKGSSICCWYPMTPQGRGSIGWRDSMCPATWLMPNRWHGGWLNSFNSQTKSEFVERKRAWKRGARRARKVRLTTSVL